MKLLFSILLAPIISLVRMVIIGTLFVFGLVWYLTGYNPLELYEMLQYFK